MFVQAASEIAVGIDEGDAMAVPNVLEHEILKQGGFARAGLPEDVQVMEAIGVLQTETSKVAAGVGFADNGRGEMHTQSLRDCRAV